MTNAWINYFSHIDNGRNSLFCCWPCLGHCVLCYLNDYIDYI